MYMHVQIFLKYKHKIKLKMYFAKYHFVRHLFKKKTHSQDFQICDFPAYLGYFNTVSTSYR